MTNPLRKRFKLNPDDLERHSKKIKKETEKQYSIFKKTRGQKERKTAVKVLYRKSTTTLHKCH